jgi:hypothetical protein
MSKLWRLRVVDLRIATVMGQLLLSSNKELRIAVIRETYDFHHEDHNAVERPFQRSSH